MPNYIQTELEATVLASVLWRPQLAATVFHRIPPDLWTSQAAFQDSSLRNLADCILDCWNARRACNPVSVSQAARMRQVTVDDTVQQLMASTAGESESTLDRVAADLAGAIRKCNLQSLISKATILLAGDEEPSTVISNVVTMINTNVGSELNIVDSSEASSLLQEQYYLRKSGKGQAIGVPTGFRRIDSIVGGLPTSAVSIIGARPSQGKTAIACCFAINAARQGFPVLFFSHEMAAQDIYLRMACELANISYTHIKHGRLSVAGEAKMNDAFRLLTQMHISVIDTGGPLPAECRTTAMYKINKWHNPKPPLIIVDYIQLEHLMHEAKPEFRPQELQEISHYWCETAKIMHAAVVLLSQLNRDAAGNQPTMAQLSQCGALEQDASCIMLLWRPSKDKSETLAEETPDPTNRKKTGYNWGILSVVKSRNSDLTEQELHFSGYNMLFRDWDSYKDRHLTKSQMIQAEYNSFMADIIQNQAPQMQQPAPTPVPQYHPVDDEDVPL